MTHGILSIGHRRVFALACIVGALSCTDSTGPSEAPVASVTVSVPKSAIRVGEKIQAAALPLDASGGVLTGREITWTSSDGDVASVSSDGLITALKPGLATITANVEGKAGTVSLSISLVPVATITLTPATATMSGGAKKQLTVTLNDADGNVLTRTVTFTSSNNSLATVSASGEVISGAGDGSVVITASVEGKSATTTLDIVTFVRMSAGFNFTCGLNAEGTAYCWGDNFNSQLGNGGTANSPMPTKVSTGLKFVAITSGQAHTCALTSSGIPYCWGDNTWGQLGSGVVDHDGAIPVAVNGGYSFTSVAAGQNSTCGSTSSLEVFCWGQTNPTPQLGPLQQNPKSVGSGMVAVVGAPTTNKYCSVDADGFAYCWIPDFVASAPSNQITAPVSSSIHFTTLRVASTHVCGVATSGEAYCWGKNDSGELGDGTTTDKANPTAVTGGLVFESVAVGTGGFVPNENGVIAGFSCGVVKGGKAYCWGVNVQGQLGRSTTGGYFSIPQAVAGGLSFSGIRAGAVHTCGLTSSGAAYCWGDNSKGQLGDGTDVAKDSPSLVFGN